MEERCGPWCCSEGIIRLQPTFHGHAKRDLDRPRRCKHAYVGGEGVGVLHMPFHAMSETGPLQESGLAIGVSPRWIVSEFNCFVFRVPSGRERMADRL